MTAERDHVVERREVVLRDLEELTHQVEDGEIDPATAERLRSGYQQELDSLDRALADLPETVAAPAPEPATAAAEALEPPTDSVAPTRPVPAPRSPMAIVLTALVIIGALTVAIVFAARDSTPDESGPVAGPGELSVDPASVTNEQLEAVVAANPDIIGMRMALADRYFAGEEFGSALGHYLHIAENATDPADEARALARVGWMAFRTGLVQEAERYLELSQDAAPGNSDAVLFRGYVTFYGLGDAEAAIPQLEAALDLPDLSPPERVQLETALEEARSGGTP